MFAIRLGVTEKSDITIIGLEPHPEDKKSAGYEKVKLSATGKEEI